MALNILNQFCKTLFWPVRSSIWLKNVPVLSRVCAVSLQSQHVSSINSRNSLPSAACQYGNKLAIVDLKEQVSYKCMLDQSFTLKETVKKICPNLVIGDRIAALTPNNALYTVCQWAIWSLGGIAVQLCQSHPLSELKYVLENSETSVIISSSEYAEISSTLAKELNIRHVMIPDEQLHQSESDFKPDDFELVEHSGIIIYTSGTTGRPKGAVHTHKSLNAQVQCLTDEWKITKSDVVLHVLPLHHIHGVVNLLMCPLTCGATVVMENKFDPKKVWDHLLQKTQPNVNLFMAVPTIYVKLIEFFDKNNMCAIETREQCKHVRLMISGSSALPSTVLHRWKEITGHVLLERYGMTEIGMGLTNPYEGQRIPGAVGLPFPGVSVQIVPPNQDGAIDLKKSIVQATKDHVTLVSGTEGTQGELLVKSPLTFKGYYNNPKATSESFIDGWFRTGDSAVFENGVFRIVGRTSVDIIKSGGHKISALDIEQQLLDHPGIAEVAVVGVQDPVWGQRVGAVVGVKEDFDITLKSLKEWCCERMPNYQIPTVLKLVDKIPRNIMGKVNKKELLQTFFTTESE